MGEHAPPDALASGKIIHASSVEVNGHALLILGGSGSGKSRLALDLIELGARLVADDQTQLESRDAVLWASPPPTIAGQIEARHVGILQLPFTPSARVALAIDLDREEPQRLPPAREIEFLGQRVTLLYRPPGVLHATAVLQCLRQRRIEP